MASGVLHKARSFCSRQHFKIAEFLLDDQIWLLAENVRCRGLTKGVAGTIVKPVAAIGTAIGEARPLWNLEAAAHCR